MTLDFDVLCAVNHNYNFTRLNLNVCEDDFDKSSSEDTLVNFICYWKRKYYNSNNHCRTKISKPFNSIVEHPKLN